jgi:hypothetical protein
MKRYGGVDVQIHVSLTLALVGGEWSASRSGERATGTHWIGGYVGPRTGLDDVEKNKFLTLPGLELRPLRRPARSQSLYRLRYPGSCLDSSTKYKLYWTRNPFLCIIHYNTEVIKSYRATRSVNSLQNSKQNPSAPD